MEAQRFPGWRHSRRRGGFNRTHTHGRTIQLRTPTPGRFDGPDDADQMPCSPNAHDDGLAIGSIPRA
jgi:hypothetical protein